VTRVFLWLLIVLFSANAPAGDAGDSLYHLDVSLTDQDGRAKKIDLYRGHPVLITMFYGSCPNVCPMIFEALRATESGLPDARRRDLRVLMVSIDPQHDTPAALAELGRKRHADPDRWTLAQANERDVRTLAAALGIQYRKLPNGEYNHTSIISLLTEDGRLVRQTSMLARADPELTAELTRKPK
jgi:protein SCO1